MDILLIDGKNFVKTTSLAKEFKYTADYLGQLCRSKKIESRLVGRSWYINPESLKAFLSTKSLKNESRSDEITLNNNVKKNLIVNPAINKKTVRYAESKKSNFSNRINWSPIKYTNDEHDLLPSFSKKIKIDLEGAKNVIVKSGEPDQNLVATELPEVLLQGDLTVTSLDTVIPEVSDSKDDLLNTDISKPTFVTEVANNEFIIKKPASVEEKENIEKVDMIKRIFFTLLIFALSSILISTIFFELEVYISEGVFLKNSYNLSLDWLNYL